MCTLMLLRMARRCSMAVYTLSEGLALGHIYIFIGSGPTFRVDDMTEALFETDFLSSLQRSSKHHHRELFAQLRGELPPAVMAKAQLAMSTVFDNTAKYVCGALRWLTAKGRIVHVAGIFKTLSACRLLLTASIDVPSNAHKITLDHVPLTTTRSPALVHNIQRQPPDLQCLV